MKDLTFIDLFAGCGGLSLGLMKAGWKGLFAIEKTEDAFNTLSHNLCSSHSPYHFFWPKWLPCKAMTTEEVINNYETQLKSLRGRVDLIAGGPPCQGFSLVGLRNPKDPRNRLTEEYIKIVGLIRPKFLLLENVRGFQTAFEGKKKPYSILVKEKVEKLEGGGYKVYSKMLKASLFGVPQPRSRFIMFAIREDIKDVLNDPFILLEEILPDFKQIRGLMSQETTVSEAIGDLEITGKPLIECQDSKGFKQVQYQPSKKLAPYQKLMREGLDRNYIPNSLRLANHKNETLYKFKEVLKKCPKGKAIPKDFRERFNMKKQCFIPLHPEKLSRAVTTLPDDLLHYSEPRILTVRENARLQSFPDWFEFKGKYTTGGNRRKQDCPRYTQVGNAVPPLMAEALGIVIKELAN
ncbi:MAG: DNA cytosine methyltransferase [Desulfurellales bacterium]|nr:MAG: DNA cytosine methyltransferase [Desulfurellales bacterium]